MTLREDCERAAIEVCPMSSLEEHLETCIDCQPIADALEATARLAAAEQLKVVLPDLALGVTIYEDVTSNSDGIAEDIIRAEGNDDPT